MSIFAARSDDRAAGFGGLYPLAGRRSGVSSEALKLRNLARRVAWRGEQSVRLFGDKQAALSELLTLVRETRAESMRNEEQQPITFETAHQATSVIRALPADVPMPEFAVEPDGAISLDWIRSRNHIVSVIVEDSAGLPYAWVDGADRGHGVVDFDGVTVPPRLLEDIRRIIR